MLLYVFPIAVVSTGVVTRANFTTGYLDVFGTVTLYHTNTLELGHNSSADKSTNLVRQFRHIIAFIV